MRVRYRFQRRGSRVMAWLLARDRPASINRRLVFLILFALLWLGALFLEYPDVRPGVAALLQPSGADPAGPAGFVFTALFRLAHPHLWRHLALAVLAVIAALAGGARYLDDIFELRDVGVALRYLRLAIFGGRYPWIEIQDGDVSEASKSSPAYLIGGPGFARIHLGNAALFEQPGGKSVVVGATAAHFLHGFERLREVVDLKNQHRTLSNLEAFTRDGIPVKAVDIEAEFRACPDRLAQSARNPYPVNPLAVRRLVYGKSVGKEETERLGPNAWANAAAGRVGGQIRRYVEGKSLDELILVRDEQPQDNPRQPLSASFYDPEVARSFEDRGVQVLWVGVGTLETPLQVSEAWMREWQSKWLAEVKSNPARLEAEKRRARCQELARFVDRVVKQTVQAFKMEDLRDAGQATGSGTRTAGQAQRVWTPGKDWSAGKLLDIYSRALDVAYKSLVGTGQLPPGVAEALAHIRKLLEPVIIGA